MEEACTPVVTYEADAWQSEANNTLKLQLIYYCKLGHMIQIRLNWNKSRMQWPFWSRAWNFRELFQQGSFGCTKPSKCNLSNLERVCTLTATQLTTRYQFRNKKVKKEGCLDYTQKRVQKWMYSTELFCHSCFYIKTSLVIILIAVNGQSTNCSETKPAQDNGELIKSLVLYHNVYQQWIHA